MQCMCVVRLFFVSMYLLGMYYVRFFLAQYFSFCSFTIFRMDSLYYRSWIRGAPSHSLILFVTLTIVQDAVLEFVHRSLTQSSTTSSGRHYVTAKSGGNLLNCQSNQITVVILKYSSDVSSKNLEALPISNITIQRCR